MKNATNVDLRIPYLNCSSEANDDFKQKIDIVNYLIQRKFIEWGAMTYSTICEIIFNELGLELVIPTEYCDPDCESIMIKDKYYD